MISNVEQIELQMLEEYERSGTIDIVEWTERYPEHRAAILRYWLWLKGTPTVDELLSDGPPVVADEVANEALHEATLAATLGGAWLEEGVAGGEAEEDRLGSELEALRQTDFRQTGKAPKTFRRATVYTWVVAEWQDAFDSVTRLRVQKATYFLEHALDLGLFTEHRKKKLGPYDHTARYRDAEPIARKKQWLSIKGTEIRPGPSVGEMTRYAGRYLRREDLARRVLSVLGSLSEAELETWSTVHSAARALSSTGREVTPGAIRELLASIAEWRDKLERSNFSERAIGRALSHLVRLRLIRT